jgi:tRNA A37 threonylcarbamoyladenosine dehydratase
MLHQFSRTELLLGQAALEKLAASKVAVFGIGGVGSFTVEGLARAGVGKLVLIDADCIGLTNLNRQLHATHKTLGQPKVAVMRDRVLEINPEATVEIRQRLYMPDCAAELVHPDYDYIVDAIDMAPAKADLIVDAKRLGVPIISCMGAGNKLDPTRFKVADIYATSVCPLAKVMRKELRQRGVVDLKVVYSDEPPMQLTETATGICGVDRDDFQGMTGPDTVGRQVIGSVSFVPSVAGLIIAGEVVKDLLKRNSELR